MFRHTRSGFVALSSFVISTLAAYADAKLPQPPLPSTPVPARPLEEKSTRTLAGGVELTTLRRNIPGAPLQLFIVKVDPKAGGKTAKWKLGVAPAEYSALQRAGTSLIARRENAPVAINGGYFAFGGAALGAMKVDGEWIRLPWKSRTAMGIDEQGRVLIDSLRGDVSVTLGAAPTAVSATTSSLNGFAPADGIAVVTPRFGTLYKLRPDEIAFEIDSGVVRNRIEANAANIRRNSWVLVARGAARGKYANVSSGQPAKLQVNESAPWRKYSTILGAGPRLLKNGQIFTTEKEEEFRPDVMARGPRTAFGVDKSGSWIFLVADGRAPEYSSGLTLPELARELQLAGATEGICLDGGGSSTLVVNGEVLNRPSDGNERKVSNALVIVPVTKPAIIEVRR